MGNRLRHNSRETEGGIDFNSINFELPEFQEIAQMAKQFCDNPGLGDRKSDFEKQLVNMSFIDLFELYSHRLNLEPGADKDVINLRARQIEKALWNYLLDRGVSSEELIKLNIDIDQMNDIYESLKGEYSH